MLLVLLPGKGSPLFRIRSLPSRQVLRTLICGLLPSPQLSQEVLDEADCYLKIPMSGFTESLNISVSAAIILQYVTAKLKATDIAWQLTEEEQNEKRLDWIKKTIKSHEDIIKRFYSDS